MCHGVLSPALAQALTRTVEAGEKAILFLNRRGYAASLVCGHCGHSWDCPHCDVTLSQIAAEELRCRICGHGEPAPAVCPPAAAWTCGATAWAPSVWSAKSRRCCPVSSFCALTPTSPRRTHASRRCSAQFAAPGAKVLVGTQMIAKGHHFPEVTLVGRGRRRPLPALPRLPRRGAHVRHAHPGRRPQRPRRPARPRDRADP